MPLQTPFFPIQKWGLKAYTLHEHVILMRSFFKVIAEDCYNTVCLKDGVQTVGALFSRINKLIKNK